MKDWGVRLPSGLNVIAALWLIASPWVLGFEARDGAVWTSVIVGAVVAVLAGIRMINPDAPRLLSWINFALAVWLLLAPRVLGYAPTHPAARTDAMIVALAVMALSALSALAQRTDEDSALT